MSFILYFDGACRGNPGKGGCGVVIYENDEIKHKFYKFIDDKVTNNIAEYEALYIGLEFLKNNEINKCTIRGDSLLLIKQLTGKYKCKSDNLKEYYNKCLFLLKDMDIKLEHIYRKDNKVADELANMALDYCNSSFI